VGPGGLPQFQVERCQSAWPCPTAPVKHSTAHTHPSPTASKLPLQTAGFVTLRLLNMQEHLEVMLNLVAGRIASHLMVFLRSGLFSVPAVLSGAPAGAAPPSARAGRGRGGRGRGGRGEGRGRGSAAAAAAAAEHTPPAAGSELLASPNTLHDW